VWRAYLDRLRPPLTIGRERSLGALVRSRMGARLRDRLVAPSLSAPGVSIPTRSMWTSPFPASAPR
jgi:hypothetical protein